MWLVLHNPRACSDLSQIPLVLPCFCVLPYALLMLGAGICMYLYQGSGLSAVLHHSWPVVPFKTSQKGWGLRPAVEHEVPQPYSSSFHIPFSRVYGDPAGNTVFQFCRVLFACFLLWPLQRGCRSRGPLRYWLVLLLADGSCLHPRVMPFTIC